MTTTRPWTEIKLPQEILTIPGMLSQEEKQYLIWLTSQAYEGWGAVVDLGCWLGCSSACLAEGLRRAQRPERVHSCDLFVWETSYMEQCYPAKLPQGADFLPVFERFTDTYRDWIDVSRVDLKTHAWTGGPVEILFIDAAKDWNLTNAIFQSYGRQIMPGKTRIVLQDFRHHFTFWLPLIMDSRQDLWQEVESVETGWTVTFVARKDVLGIGGLQLPYSASDFDFEFGTQIFQSRIDAARGEAREFYRQGQRQLATAIQPSEAVKT